MSQAQWFRVEVAGQHYRILARLRKVDTSEVLAIDLIRAEQVRNGHFIEVNMPVGAAEAVKAEMMKLA